MATLTELRAVDRLIRAVESEGFLLNVRVSNGVQAILSRKDGDMEQVRKYLLDSILESSGNLAPALRRALIETCGLPAGTGFVPFEDVGIDRTAVVVNTMSEDFSRTGSLGVLNNASRALTDRITAQLDQTQDALRPRQRWVRHLNAGACDYCREQERQGRWSRHDSCKCVRVRVA